MSQPCDRSDFDFVVTATYWVAVGVMVALVLATWFWPAPRAMQANAVHHTIVGSAVDQLREEPREKAFFTLAAVLGFSGGLLGGVLPKLAIKANAGSLGLLILIAAAANLACDRALNEPSGWIWGLCGLLLTSLCAAAARKMSR